MRTAQEMFDFVQENKFLTAETKKMTRLHFELIEEALEPDEDVLFCFVGMHNASSLTKSEGYYAYAFTNKRIIYGRRNLVGRTVSTLLYDNLNDITTENKVMFGTVTISTKNEIIRIGLPGLQVQVIGPKLHNILHEQKSKGNAPQAASDNKSAAEQLKEFKELLDMGILTQEEFDAKKKELLNL